MFWLACTIEFQRLKPIRTPVGVTITRGWAQRADTCTLQLPRGVQLRSGTSLRDAIRQGDSVSVKLGYNDRQRTEFEGYVSEPPKAKKASFEVQCEDTFYRLKRTPAAVSFKDASLQTLVSEIVPGDIPTEVAAATIGPYRKADTTAGAILADLAEEYNLVSYFREGTLHVGLRYPSDAPTVRYNMSKNVAENSLEFVRAEDMQLQVKAKSLQPGGKRLTVTVPEDAESGYDTRTFAYQGLSKEELKKRAESKLEELKFDGYKGSFKAFGRPYIEHGWRVDLRDPRFPEYDGSYLVDEVKTTFGAKGMFRSIKLGPALESAQVGGAL